MAGNSSPSTDGRSRDPLQLDGRRATLLLLRALRLRCPNCGGGPLFRRWVVARHACPRCRLLLDRGEHDYFLGSYTINFVVAELLIVVGAGVGIVLSWPHVPWSLITWSLMLLMVVAPVVFYPFSKTLWLALDLALRPLTLKDLEDHGESLPPDEREGGTP